LTGAVEALRVVEVVARALLGPAVRLRARLLVERVAFLGVAPSDSDEVRVQKVTLTLTAVVVTLLSVVWVGTYLALGPPESAGFHRVVLTVEAT